MMTDAMADTIAEAVIDVGFATIGTVFGGGGSGPDLVAANARQLHVLHVAIGVQTGAADEVEYYGGDL